MVGAEVPREAENHAATDRVAMAWKRFENGPSLQGFQVATLPLLTQRRELKSPLGSPSFRLGPMKLSSPSTTLDKQKGHFGVFSSILIMTNLRQKRKPQLVQLAQ